MDINVRHLVLTFNRKHHFVNRHQHVSFITDSNFCQRKVSVNFLKQAQLVKNEGELFSVIWQLCVQKEVFSKQSNLKNFWKSFSFTFLVKISLRQKLSCRRGVLNVRSWNLHKLIFVSVNSGSQIKCRKSWKKHIKQWELI